MLAFLGVAVGVYGTLVGLGGGFLVVPLLLLIYKLSPPAAAATSLVVVFLNAASGSAGYLRRRRVDLATGIVLAAGTIPGALIGPWVAERTPERAFKVALSLFLFAMAVFLYLRPAREITYARPPRAGFGWVHRRFRDAEGMAFEYTYNVPLALAISFVVGILASLFGIGGGIVHVPAMLHLMSFPVHIATATSQFVLAITALTGMLEYARRDYIEWPVAIAIGVGVVAGAQIGAAVSHRMHGRRIVRLLIIAIVLLAGRLMWSAVRG
ncbi:MAG: sulfite exporter TauE/SafE family protein [Gemmatimonadota bacterium]|nr:sulfite exporter TauE/SafE family protein [Gemmatimonadota bacterium]